MNALVVLSALVAVASASGFSALPYTGYGYSALPYAAHGYSALPYAAHGYSALPYAGYTGYSALPYNGYTGYNGYAAPYSYASTYHSQDELGQASYGHAQADQSHAAVRDAYGNVAGGYSYISPEGKPITVRYTAGVNGFQVESNALPVAPVDTNVAPRRHQRGARLHRRCPRPRRLHARGEGRHR
ncbi:cuticle protein 7-like [Pollicipes pollicipes]|uniref:cuticle protein 7-like n=1 Tax=Pollicipes pollicipes TaxID=41117 RepID=UPI001884E8FD|nr:cuticle protein 7-like [Pollicipes pollicipes]